MRQTQLPRSTWRSAQDRISEFLWLCHIPLRDTCSLQSSTSDSFTLRLPGYISSYLFGIIPWGPAVLYHSTCLKSKTAFPWQLLLPLVWSIAPFRIVDITWGAQYKVKMWGSLIKYYSDTGSRCSHHLFQCSPSVSTSIICQNPLSLSFVMPHSYSIIPISSLYLKSHPFFSQGLSN